MMTRQNLYEEERHAVVVQTKALFRYSSRKIGEHNVHFIGICSEPAEIKTGQSVEYNLYTNPLGLSIEKLKGRNYKRPDGKEWRLPTSGMWRHAVW
jgi:hypothetical protein